MIQKEESIQNIWLRIKEDRVHFKNGTYFVNQKFINQKEWTQNRLTVNYNKDTPKPEKWLTFLDGLLEADDIVCLQEFMGYCLIPSNRGQRMLLIIGKGGEGKSRIGGILKRIFVVDCGDEEGNSVPYVFINPEIIDREGVQTGYEGCLSVPGKSGMVPRAQKVKVKAFNENMEEFEMEAEGLLARCILHENDHLDGIVYVDKVEGKLYDNSELYPEEEQ